MTSTTTILNCSTKTAFILFLLIGSLFILAGCASLYRTIGLTDAQTADQVAKDQADRQQIIGSIRLTTTELITTAVAGLGAIASGFLARWLGTERKITTALITGIESSMGSLAKESVQKKAFAAGIESQLHARVVALT